MHDAKLCAYFLTNTITQKKNNKYSKTKPKD